RKIPERQKRGLFSSLESAYTKGALSTFPPPRLRLLHLVKIQPRKELSSATAQTLPSGSSFDWKRLLSTSSHAQQRQCRRWSEPGVKDAAVAVSSMAVPRARPPQVNPRALHHRLHLRESDKADRNRYAVSASANHVLLAGAHQ